MIVGFNHNVMYKSEMFHIQTEDSGINNPHIITLLYRGGNIVSSIKTSYRDIVNSENFEQVVEGLMKEQHKDMLRRLKSGECDARIGLTPSTTSTNSAPEPINLQTYPAPPRPAPVPLKSEPLKTEPATPAAVATELPLNIQPAAPPVKQKQSLDDIIFDFLTAGDDK